MRPTPGPPRGMGRLRRALGFDGNPLRRASHRAEAWIRVGLLAVFLIAGPPAAIGAGHWAYHAEITGAQAQAAHAYRVKAVVPQPAPSAAGLAGVYRGGHAWATARGEDAADSALSDEVLAGVMTLAFLALALLAALRVTLAFLSRRRLAAWETAWSKVGPQWTGGRS